MSLSRQAAASLIEGRHGKPHEILGAFPSLGKTNTWFVRSFLPGAKKVELEFPDRTRSTMSQDSAGGIFEIEFAASDLPRYHRIAHYENDYIERSLDPYSFRDLLNEYDLHLLAEGTHYRSYQKLGAHLETKDGTSGTRFAVWAPNAESVCVMGDFNRWDRCVHPMQLDSGTGIWQLFLPEVGSGSNYKYLVRNRDGTAREKIDPLGFYFERPPKTASRVFDLSVYSWNDQAWIEKRRQTDWLRAPLSLYEVHLGSWMRDSEGEPLDYRTLAERLVPWVKDLGFTHLELLPITEHPFSGSWGYQTTGYFAPTSRFGTPDDFRYFVEACHTAELGVFLDWVPAHFPRDTHALALFDGTHLYEHADPRQGAHPDWGTLIFNFGRNEVRNFLISSALFWLDEYHLDGLRVDAVASMLYLDYSRQPGEWVANRYGGKENLEAISFLKTFNEVVHEYCPGTLTMAEESTSWPGVSRPTYLGGLGFSLKWNMGWMHDSLAYIQTDPIFRRYQHEKLTFSMLYAFSENYILPLSHDEVVHGKGSLLSKQFGDQWQKRANLRLYFTYMYTHPGKKLLFMGCELGQLREWDSESALEWPLLGFEEHLQFRDFLAELNRIYRTEPSLHEVDFDWTGFQWVDFRDQDQSVVAFLRMATDPANSILCIFNHTPVVREGYEIGVPAAGSYEELLNSDSQFWEGSNVGNMGAVISSPKPQHGFEHSIRLRLPPLAALLLRVPRPEENKPPAGNTKSEARNPR